MTIFDHRTGPLKKSDMSTQYRYADGPTANDDPTKRGHPDRDLLNRNEWYEMLYFCNKFANDHGQQSKSVAQKAERLIHQRVPSSVHSRERISRWLLDNWASYA